MDQATKRNIAYKMKIGSLLAGKPIIEGERLKCIEIGSKQLVRTNIIANVVDKFVQDGEKKFASLTLDDGSGQIRAKAFGDDIEKFAQFSQGDTLLIIGLLRSWNNEIYLTPEIIKKKDSVYLLIRKFEIEINEPKGQDKEKLQALKDRILNLIKTAENDGGIEIEKIILQSNESPDSINQEIKKLLEDGIVYEPRPGKLRWLG